MRGWYWEELDVIVCGRSHFFSWCLGCFLTGDVFRDLIDKFLRTSLRKGVPSIFVSIKVHYKDPEKVSSCLWSMGGGSS